VSAATAVDDPHVADGDAEDEKVGPLTAIELARLVSKMKTYQQDSTDVCGRQQGLRV
jgi:hypothetical protein